MQKNVGTIDRVIRIALALVLGILYYAGYFTGVFGLIMLIVAIILLVTGLIGWCGIYSALGVSTKKEDGGDSPGPQPQNPEQPTSSQPENQGTPPTTPPTDAQ